MESDEEAGQGEAACNKDNINTATTTTTTLVVVVVVVVVVSGPVL
jgi:hypothetical protein